MYDNNKTFNKRFNNKKNFDNKNKFTSRRISEFSITLNNSTVTSRDLRLDGNTDEEMYLKENKDNIYISIRTNINPTDSVTEHYKFYKNAIAEFHFTELVYHKEV